MSSTVSCDGAACAGRPPAPSRCRCATFPRSAPAARAAAPSRARRPPPRACRLRDPAQLGVARRFEQLAHRGLPDRRGAVEGAGDRALGQLEQEGGEVARVDDLQRAVGPPGRGDGAALADPAHPPGQPEDVVVRADDQAGADGRAAAGEHVALGGGLVGPVALAVLPRGRVLVDRLVGPVRVGVAARTRRRSGRCRGPMTRRPGPGRSPRCRSRRPRLRLAAA